MLSSVLWGYRSKHKGLGPRSHGVHTLVSESWTINTLMRALGAEEGGGVTRLWGKMLWNEGLREASRGGGLGQMTGGAEP